MDHTPVYLFAKWKVKEGQLNNVLPLLPELAEKSRAEEGNLFYKLHQSNSDQHTLMLYEGYADANAVEAHRNSKHFQELVLVKIVPILESREAVLASELNI